MVEGSLINEVKMKKEFSMLPDSVVSRALDYSKGDIKGARSFLRKYLGVFLTNKVLKGRDETLLKKHISSKKRDYDLFYSRIFEDIGSIGSVIDLGCGVNSFSYDYLQKLFGSINYIGVEASGQLVDSANDYFDANGFSTLCNVLQGDLFDTRLMITILKKSKKKRAVFLFQVIDALESFEKDFSKKLLQEISKECEYIIITLPLVSLGGRKTFDVQRKWLTTFLEENFSIINDFEIFGERVIVVNTHI